MMGRARSFKIDPRTKLISFVSLIVFAFTCRDVWVLLCLISVVVMVSLNSRERIRVLRGLKVMVPVLLVAFFLWSFLYRWSLFYSYEGLNGLQIGLFMTVRLLLIIVTSLSFISVTTPSEIIRALESFKLPYELVFVFGLTLRHINTVTDEFISIKEAQMSRGLELDKGFLVRRIRNYIPILIPLLIRSIENAEKLVLAMELKSFSFKKKRRYLKKTTFNKIDYMINVSMLAIASLSVLHYVMGVV